MSFNSLEEIYTKLNYGKGTLEKYKYLESYILELFNNRTLMFNSYDPNTYCWIGIYYGEIEKNYELGIKYYLMAIEAGDVDSMVSLGYHYYKNEKKYELAIKYYLMAIDAGHVDAMNYLGIYYWNDEKKYELGIKYFLMAVEAGDSNAMCNSGFYYEKIEKNYELAIKYYLMAIEAGNVDAMSNLGHYYESIEKNYELGIKYFLMAAEKGNDLAINYLNNFKNTLKLYGALVKMVKTNEISKELIDKYLLKCLTDSKVKSYVNKLRIFKNLNNYAQCPVCLDENVLNIILECGHEICSNCYVNIDAQCYYNFCN